LQTPSHSRLRAVGISGSPSGSSKSRTLVEYALRQLGAAGADTVLVDLARLPANELLGRRPPGEITGALASVAAARVIVVGTPVYRATYSGLLKVFFDLLPQDSLLGKIGLPIMTGHGPAHSLALDHGLRPLFASLGATTVPSGVYGTNEQFVDGAPGASLAQATDRAVREALLLASDRTPDR